MVPRRDNNFTYLLIGLILYLLVGPVLQVYFPDSLFGAELILRLGFNVLLLVGVWSFRDSILHIRLGWGLTTGTLVLTLISIMVESEFIDHVLFLVFFLFCLLSLRLCFHEVVYGGEMDANRLVGSACVYLLMGICWGVLFYYIESTTPGSFKGVSLASSEYALQDLLYFSFVTLTTLGYGDISPVNSVAQAVSYLEAVAGAVYLAVLVAVLVGAFFAQSRERSGDAPPAPADSHEQENSLDERPS